MKDLPSEPEHAATIFEHPAPLPVTHLERVEDPEPNKPTIAPKVMLEMPLGTFASQGLTLRVWSQILDEEVWFVSGEAEMHTLVRQGVHRGKVYTAQELLTLLNLPGMDRERLKRIQEAKKLFNGTVQAATP